MFLMYCKHLLTKEQELVTVADRPLTSKFVEVRFTSCLALSSCEVLLFRSHLSGKQRWLKRSLQTFETCVLQDFCANPET